MTRFARYRKRRADRPRGPMRLVVTASALLLTLAAAATLAGCDGCGAERGPSAEEREKILTRAIAAPPPSARASTSGGIGHPANVIPGEGPKRIESKALRSGQPFPILPGQGIGPIRIGANQQTIERLMAAPCDQSSAGLCRYVARAVEFKLEGGVTKEIKISRKGREAERTPDGSIVEYGFFNGAILPDLYFGMQPSALMEELGQPQKVEKIWPLGNDGFAERHLYDGITLEYDRWSNGNLVLGAAIITKSDTAAAATEKAEAARVERAAAAAKNPRKTRVNKPPR
jgi:hypothetical protein